MKCLFCKSVTNPFASVEHIIPQSIGNVDHILPKGIVCDLCNNYFSRKVENGFINSEALLDIRRRMNIPNKHGKIPISLKNNSFKAPEQRVVARFLAKVGLEVLAQRAISGNVPNWQSDIIENKNLDTVRNFARYNISDEEWPFIYRVLHPVNATFFENNEYYEVLHEYDLLYTKANELYLVLSIFGVEFTINMGGPTIEGYKAWLVENNFESHLYIRKKVQR